MTSSVRSSIASRKGVQRSLAAVLLLAATSAGIVAAVPSRPATDDWPSYGRTLAEQRFSPLAAINPRTVSRLGVAWYHQFDTDRGQEATPLMVDGVLYVSTSWSKVYAFDAVSGKLRWSFDPKVPPKTLFSACCDAVNRGVAVADGRVFVGTLDGRLIALDARSGRQSWSIRTTDPAKPYTITGAPRVIDHKVLIGNGGAEYGVRGYITAYDSRTGRLVWRFYTTPNPDGRRDGQPSDRPLKDKASASWFGTGWKTSGGGGTVWDAIAYDPEADLLYFGVGNGGPWSYKERSDGKGDNLFIASIVAVRPKTGEYVWHYQATPGDSWDFTSTQQITLADLTIDGKRRKVLLQAPKNGFFYVLDRLTGELLSAKPYVPVTWATSVDLKTGRPNIAEGAHYLSNQALIQPWSLGGHSWHPMAFSPQTGLVYIPAQVCPPFAYEPEKNYVFRDGHENLGIGTSTFDMPTAPKDIAQVRAAFHGELIAWDPVAQRARWRVVHPFFLNGGVLATAGKLVFQGTAEGSLVAYDAADGKQVWSYKTENGIVAAPISYAVGGRQYVAVMVGYGGFGALLGTIVPDRPRLPGRLLVFALDGKGKLPAYDIPAPLPIDSSDLASAGDVGRGRALYSDHCVSCHGISAGSGFVADLRRSPVLHSPDAWQQVVIDGVLQERGMVSFAKYMNAKDAEDVRAYVVDRAIKTKLSEERN